jgi:lipopolysaccharide/colanic/teichoic acid biosynthesis glycosyltransferase
MKRFTDLSIAAILIVLTLPLMAIVALAIRLESPGLVLTRRGQLHRDGRRFELLRFRTTSHRASSALPRRTRIGWFLHYTRIEELPQLVNVLRGELTFVGDATDRSDQRRFGT